MRFDPKEMIGISGELQMRGMRVQPEIPRLITHFPSRIPAVYFGNSP